MNPEAIQKIIDAIEKNGGSGLDALAAYRAASAYGDLILLVISPLVLIAAIYGIVRLTKMTEHFPCDSWEERLCFGGLIASVIIAGLSALILLVGTVMLPNTLAAIKNPRGAAIYELLKK